MVCAIFGKLKEISAVIWGNLIFLLDLVCSADLDIPCSGLFFNRVKFYSFIKFMHKISTRMVYVTGQRPKFHVLGSFQSIFWANLIL